MPVAHGDSHVVVLAEVDGTSVRSVVDPKAQLYRQDFTVVYLIRDHPGRIVRKLSQRFRVSGPADRLEAARGAKTLSYRQTELPPGSYSVEAAVWDALAEAGGLTRTSILVSEAPEGRPRLGSLMLLGHAEPAGDDLAADHPLRYGGVLLYPNLGEPLSRRLAHPIAFFLAARSATPVAAAITVSSGSDEVIEQALSPTTPSADGIARFVGSLPIDSLASGEYELRITVGTSDAAQTRRATFTVVN
jgi:hypothetical protein